LRGLWGRRAGEGRRKSLRLHWPKSTAKMSVFTGKMEVAGISRENAMEASLKVSLGEHSRPILWWSILWKSSALLDDPCCQHDMRG